MEDILNATINNLEYTAEPGSRIEEQLIELKAIIDEGGGNAKSLSFDIIPDTYIDNGGAEKAAGGWSSTDYIDISGYTTLYVTSFYDTFNAFYDENKTWISMFRTESNIVTVPEGAVYARLSDPSNIVAQGKIFVEL